MVLEHGVGSGVLDQEWGARQRPEVEVEGLLGLDLWQH